MPRFFFGFNISFFLLLTNVTLVCFEKELEVSPHDNGHVHNHTDDSDDNDKKDDIDHNSTEKLEEKPDVPDIQTDAYVDVRELLEPTITHF